MPLISVDQTQLNLAFQSQTVSSHGTWFGNLDLQSALFKIMYGREPKDIELRDTTFKIDGLKFPAHMNNIAFRHIIFTNCDLTQSTFNFYCSSAHIKFGPGCKLPERHPFCDTASAQAKTFSSQLTLAQSLARRETVLNTRKRRDTEDAFAQTMAPPARLLRI